MENTDINTAEFFCKKEKLGDIFYKINNNEKLSLEDGVLLYKSDNLPLIGMLANIVRERLNGKNTYYIYNQHINYSNICKNLCKFCAFGKPESDSKAYQLTIEDVAKKVKDRINEPIREIHIVGGLHPTLPLEYYTELLKTIKSIRPEVKIKAFTAVEFDHFAKISGKTIIEILQILINAGLDAIPGGGAEVFSPRIREKLCSEKISGEKWLEISKTAHKLGLKTNATMLYGHIETIEERVEHLIALRDAQQETNGFNCFIPLSFHPKNTKISDIARTSGVDDLKTIAISRLILDNFPHIKAYWIMLGTKIAQIAQSFGADDLDGTVMEEKITHMAGAESPDFLTRIQMEKLIIDAGRIPVERDAFFNPV
jgi:aminodeoxyfutalosine synthase